VPDGLVLISTFPRHPWVCAWQVEIQKKRVILLSQQTCKGMAKNYGVNYDPTEFANILNQAFKVRARNRQAAAQRSAAGACRLPRSQLLVMFTWVPPNVVTAGGNGQTTARSRRTHGGETGRRGSTRRGSTRRGSQHTRASADEDSEASESDLRALQVLEAVLKFGAYAEVGCARLGAHGGCC